MPKRMDTPAQSREHLVGGERLGFIDGMRGIAILLVVGYHYFAFYGDRPGNHYPYGNVWSGFPIFEYGYYGVHLFFVVSGFVITLTLQRTRGLLEFAIKRFARLWPPILLCATFSFSVLTLWPDFWPQSVWNFVPSLTFLDGFVVYEKVFPELDAVWIDGAYWSLFVEVRFYFYAALIYFAHPARFFINFGLFSTVAVVSYCVGVVLGRADAVAIMHDALIAPYLPWFVGGIAAYAWVSGERSSAGLFVISVLTMSCLWSLEAPGASLPVALLIFTLFAACFSNGLIRQSLSAWWLRSVGRGSYSLYLLHGAAGITMTYKIASFLDWKGPSSVILAIFMFVFMILLSQTIYHLWERPWNTRIIEWYSNQVKEDDSIRGRDIRK